MNLEHLHRALEILDEMEQSYPATHLVDPRNALFQGHGRV
jgi:hypothetical protein